MRCLRSTTLLAASALLLVLAGCAGNGAAPTDQAQVKESVDQILAEPLESGDYAKPRHCLSTMAYRDVEVLSERYIVFEGPGGRYWLNELRSRCPGLRSWRTLVFERHGSQICSLDQFRVTDWLYWPRYQRWPWDWWEGVPCTLGQFQPVTETQVQALRDAIDG